MSSSLFAKHRYGLLTRSGRVPLIVPPITSGAYRRSQRAVCWGSARYGQSARGNAPAGHLPHVAAPVVVGAGVLAAVNPDLVVEDNAIGDLGAHGA